MKLVASEGDEHFEAELGAEGLGIEEISDAGRARLLDGSGRVRAGWELLLLAADWAEAEADHEAQLRERWPKDLTTDDLEFLGQVATKTLPPVTELKLHVDTVGVRQRPGYGMRCEWRHPGGTAAVTPDTTNGGLLSLAGDTSRMTLGQYEVMKAVARTDFDAPGTNHQWLTAEVLGAAPQGDTGVSQASFLRNRPVRQVSNVKPRIIPTGKIYQLRPKVEGVSDADMEQYYYKTRADELGRKTLDARKPDGAVERVIFDPRARQALRRCRELHKLAPRDVAKAMSDPHGFFGDDLDVSELSDRVTGLGPLVRRPVPIVKELQSQSWFDWDVVLDLEPTTFEDPAAPPAASDSASLKDPKVLDHLRTAIEAADADGSHYVPSPDGSGLWELTPQLREAVSQASVLEEEAATQGSAQQQPTQAVLQVRDNFERLNFDKALSQPPPAIEEHEPPRCLRKDLFPHQLHGFRWLCSVYEGRHAAERRETGAVLADDMGLGKTVQVLALLGWLCERSKFGPFLVVAPVALLENWTRESAFFLGDTLEPHRVVQGRSLPADPSDALRALSSCRLVLTSYESLRAQEAVFARVPWDVVVLDEAQKAKNPGSQIARVVRTLQARFRLAVSGTPVENTLAELWTIYDWAIPGQLGTLTQFAEEYVRPAQTDDVDELRELSGRLNDRIGGTFLRRMKQDVLADLPPLERMTHVVPLSSTQEARYLKIGSGPDTALARIGRLFGVSAHPDLLAAESALRSSLQEPYPKADELFRILDSAREAGEKVLIFANRKRLQRWLAQEVEARYGVDVDTINGDVTGSRRRLGMVERFSARAGFAALVLAPRAAGVGLNITAANHVIHFTREWNPAIENQATDRAYRIGQKRTVYVHYPITSSPRGETVEQRLDALLEQKRSLMRSFVVPMGGGEVDQGQLDRDGGLE